MPDSRLEMPSPHQALALELAVATGRSRRLPGGWWVGDDHPQRPQGVVLSPDKGFRWVAAHTVKACVARGWMVYDGNYHAAMTEAGRIALEYFRAADQKLPVDDNAATPAP